MGIFDKFVSNPAAAFVLFGLVWRTLIAAGIGAVAGSGSSIGAVGGAVMGGFVGYEVGK